MSKNIYRALKGTCPYVLLFGVVVGISLLLQCFIPFLQKMAELRNGEWQWFLNIFNSQFVLPMDVISQFWAAISATYVGLDRAAYTFDAFKNGSETVAFDETRMVQLTQVIWLSFIIYAMSVGLNAFFNAELALTPLFVSFGSSMLCYVAGNKAVVALQRLSKYDDDDDEDSDGEGEFLEGLTEIQMKTMERLSNLLRQNKQFIVKIDKESKIIGMSH